jgi:predicted Zn-ribbon and HTH transcriptional regulator
MNDNINNEKEEYEYDKGINNKNINKTNIFNSTNTNGIPSDNSILISKNENNQQPLDLFEEEPVLRSQGRKLKNTSSNDDNTYSKESKLMLESQNKEIIINEEQPKEVKENNEEEQKKEDKNEAYEDVEKIRKKIKIMDRLNKARARSCGKKDEKAKISNDILMKAKLLESVLGNLKKPEDLNNNNNNAIGKESIKNDNIENNINRDHSYDMHIIQKKKKKKNNIPFDG